MASSVASTSSFDPGGGGESSSSSSSRAAPTLTSLPPEILSYIIRLIYLDSIPRTSHRNLDLHGLPSTYVDGRTISSSHSRVQQTLWSLCLCCHATYNEARPLLYRRINVSLPHSFTLLLRTLGAAALATAYERFQQTGRLPEDAQSLVAAAGFARVLGTQLVMTEDEVRARRGERSSDDDPQLDDDEHLQLTWQSDSSRFTVSLRQLSELQDCVRVIDFSAFTTQGMRRTIGQGIEARFVTSARLLALLTAAPNLAAFGASQTMDSSLSVEVLEALLFRGGGKANSPRRAAKLRGVSVDRRGSRSGGSKKRRRGGGGGGGGGGDDVDDEEERDVVSLSALDLTDCVSSVFEAAVGEFVGRHLNVRTTHTLHEESGTETETTGDEATTTGDEDDDDDEDGAPRRGRSRAGGSGANSIATSSAVTVEEPERGRRGLSRTRSRSTAPPNTRSTTFPLIERLNLSGITWHPSTLLHPFLRAFTGLTHLDVSRTRIDADLLLHLAASPTIHLESLSLAGCRSLNSTSITELLIDSPVTADLAELSLEGSLLFPTPLERHHLAAILSEAPCFRAGRLRYLDIGGCGCDDELLLTLPAQPFLLDLGLGASPGLTLPTVARFLRERAANVQVLELSDSCYNPAVTSGVLALDVATHLIGPCCTTPPLPLSLQLARMGFRGHDPGQDAAAAAAEAEVAALREPTNLRVVGLNGPSLRNVRAGFGSWKVVWGSGKRGWLVDTSAGPSPDAKDSDLMEAHDDGEVTEERGARPTGLVASPPAAAARSRSRRRGYEPETPPLGRSPSRHREAALSRSRSRGPAGARGSPHATLMRGASFSGLRPQPSPPPSPPAPTTTPVRPEIVRNLPPGHPRRAFLESLAAKSSAGGGAGVSSEVGWHSRKMETLLGFGMLGRERGSYAFAAYCRG